MRIESSRNFSRDTIFESMRNAQAEAVSRGAFKTAEEVFKIERGLQKLSGDDAVELLRNVEKKQDYWKSERSLLWKIPAWAALSVGPGAAIGGLIGRVAGDTPLGVVLGVVTNLTATAVLAYQGETGVKHPGTYYVVEEGRGPLKGFIDLEEDKTELYNSLAAELKRVTKSLDSGSAPVKTPDRAKLEEVLEQLKDTAEKSADLEKVIEVQDNQDFLHRAKGNNLLEIFRQNKDRESVADLIFGLERQHLTPNDSLDMSLSASASLLA